MQNKHTERPPCAVELPDYHLLLDHIKRDWQRAIHNLESSQLDYGFLPTIKHQAQIKPLTDHFYQVTGIEFICFCLIIGNVKYIISNCPELAVPFRLYQIPNFAPMFDPYINQFQDYTFDDNLQVDATSQLITHSLSEIFKLYPSYVLIREGIECDVLIICGGSIPSANPSLLYQKTRRQTENFAIYFFNELKNVLVEHTPWLKPLRFFKTANFREQVIKGSYNLVNPLTQQQLNTLIWASKGNTAKEIAGLMGLSVHTVREYLQECVKRLKAVNLTHAVLKAKEVRLL